MGLTVATTRTLRLPTLLLALSLFGCGGDDGEETPTDSGPDAELHDAGIRDAGRDTDDGGAPPDAASSDAGECPDERFVEAVVTEVQPESATFSFSMNANMPGRLCYHPAEEPGARRCGRCQFDRSYGIAGNEHTQTLDELTSDTGYVVYVQTSDMEGASFADCDTMTWTDISCGILFRTEGVPVDARRAFWEGSGYTLQFSNTPATTDFGLSADEYFSGDWANGQPLLIRNGGENVSFAEAPDGTPAMRSVTPAGGIFNLNYKGQQLGQENSDRDAVFAVEIYIDPDNPIVSNGESGVYVGTGHYWGSRPGVTRSPGGSTNYDDAWSVRSPLSRSNTLFAYLYPSRTGDLPGLSAGSSTSIPEGRWVWVETEVVQNDPASSSNGTVASWLDGESVAEHTNIQIRNDDDTYPKGMAVFIAHNLGAPSQEIFYLRNWRIYTR